MSHFDSKSLHNICIVRLQGPLLLIHDNKFLSVFCLGTKRIQFMWINTSVFYWLHFKKWCSEFNEYSFTQKSTESFLSAEVLPTNLATNVYRRELNLIHQLKTFTLPMVLVSHQIINNWSNSQCWVCAWTPHLLYSSRKNSRTPALNPVTNWFQGTPIGCPPHRSFTIHFLSSVAHRHSDLGISSISHYVSIDPIHWKVSFAYKHVYIVGNAHYLFLFKTLQEVKIHSSVV